MRTYARSRACLDSDLPRLSKRVCLGLEHVEQRKGTAREFSSASSTMADSSSNPSSSDLPIFSSDGINTSPMSSVPPSPEQNPPLSERETRVLQEVSTNICARPRQTKPLRQMQIDLGGEVRKTCKLCQMQYVPSIKQDAQLHRDFCNVHLRGIDVGKALLREIYLHRVTPSDDRLTNKMVLIIVDRKSSPMAKNRVRSVLDVVNAELCAPSIEKQALWSPVASDNTRDEHSRYKAILALDGDRCVGMCLAEKISKAFEVDVAQEDGSSISITSCARVALLGISRIWTSKGHRNMGIASELLDCARRSFFFGIEVPKELVAFSQPTDSGGRLARRWHGTTSGWLVYGE